MGGVSQYFSKVSWSKVDLTLLKSEVWLLYRFPRTLQGIFMENLSSEPRPCRSAGSNFFSVFLCRGLGVKFPGPFLAGTLLQLTSINCRKWVTNPEIASINVCWRPIFCDFSSFSPFQIGAHKMDFSAQFPAKKGPGNLTPNEGIVKSGTPAEVRSDLFLLRFSLPRVLWNLASLQKCGVNLFSVFLCRGGRETWSEFWWNFPIAIFSRAWWDLVVADPQWRKTTTRETIHEYIRKLLIKVKGPELFNSHILSWKKGKGPHPTLSVLLRNGPFY